jgi:spermidine synthase
MSIEILAYEETPLGLLCLRRRELVSRPGQMVTEVTLNHEFLMSSYLTESERTLSSEGLQRVAEKVGPDSEAELRVLVGGFGLGYTAAAALASPAVTSVEVIEFLPQVIGWFDAGLIPLADSLKADSRLTVTQGDIYQRLASTATTEFVLIAIDVDHSPQDTLGDQSFGFYTEEGLRQAQSHLSPGGVLGVWSYDDNTPLLEKMRRVFVDVDVEQVTVWNDLIDVEQTDWLFFGRRPR